MYTDAGEATHVARARGSATIVAIGPLLLLGALLWHPPLPGRLPDSNAVADAAAADTTRWGLSHLALAIASAMIVLSFVAVRGHLRDCGDRSLSAVGLGFVVMGSTLHAVLPGLELSVLAAAETGADLAATQDALESWFVPVLIAGSLLFAIGTSSFAVAVVRSAAFGRTEALMIAGASPLRAHAAGADRRGAVLCAADRGVVRVAPDRRGDRCPGSEARSARAVA